MSGQEAISKRASGRGGESTGCVQEKAELFAACGGRRGAGEQRRSSLGSV